MFGRLTGLATAAMAVTLLHAAAGPEARSPTATGISAAQSAESVEARDLSGRAVDPFAMANGKPVVFIFVRTDCPISNRYAPTIQGLAQKYSGRAAMMLIYPDKAESSANIRKHLQEYGYKIEALQDPSRALVNLGQAEITPEAAVFNSKGELIYHGRIDNWYKEFGRARSAPTTHELDEAIQAALDSRHPTPASVSGVGCYISDLK